MGGGAPPPVEIPPPRPVEDDVDFTELARQRRAIEIKKASKNTLRIDPAVGTGSTGIQIPLA